MYTITTGRDAAPAKGGLAAGPLLAICCLLLLLFAIASTIVLALIPVYLPRKEVTTNDDSVYFALATDDDVGGEGALDSTAREGIARSIEQSEGLPTGSLSVDSATVTSTAGRRRRRRNNLMRSRRQSRAAGGSIINCVARFLKRLCQNLPRLCKEKVRPIFVTTVTFIRDGIVRSVTITVRRFETLQELSNFLNDVTTAASTASTSAATTASTTPSMTG